MSIWEKLLMPAGLSLLFILLSGGFMFGVGGATPRMRIVLKGAAVFVLGMLFSMAWHVELAQVFRWEDAWIGTTAGSGLAGVLLAKRLFRQQAQSSG
jgi:hypothetical protein